jgi:hypothetical protein
MKKINFLFLLLLASFVIMGSGHAQAGLKPAKKIPPKIVVIQLDYSDPKRMADIANELETYLCDTLPASYYAWTGTGKETTGNPAFFSESQLTDLQKKVGANFLVTGVVVLLNGQFTVSLKLFPAVENHKFVSYSCMDVNALKREVARRLLAHIQWNQNRH